MKLYYWNESPNFGDELNPWIWSRLLPAVLDDDASVMFVGIGTLINDWLPNAPRTVFFGTGYGYEKKQVTPPGTWKFYCVRGPLTATALGLDPNLAVTDAAYLVKDLYQPSGKGPYRYAFMPHWAKANESWRVVCAELGFDYIDPTQSVDAVLRQVSGCEVLIAEAMHGAIVADALGVPWIPAQTAEVLSFKWLDWCGSIGVEYAPSRIPSLWSLPEGASLAARMRNLVKRKLAMASLRSIVKGARPRLSDRRRMEALVAELRARLERLREDAAEDRLPHPATSARSS